MSRRPNPRAIVCGLGLAATLLAVAPYFSVAHAQSADLVLCDRIAADPTDPDKPSSIPGVPRIASQDIPIAIKFCKAAAGGSRRASYELGRAYAANGQLVEAIVAYRKAVTKGSTAAMVELAISLEAGAGIAKDDAQARALLQRAAAAGNSRALTRLATAGNVSGGAADPARQREMLMRAAEGNSADAQFQLGLMYANGLGGPKDDVTAGMDGLVRGERARWPARHRCCEGLLQPRSRAWGRGRESATQTPRMLDNNQGCARSRRGMLVVRH